LQTGSDLISSGVPASTQDDVAADEEASSAAPPWTAGPAVETSPLPYGVACGTPAALFAATPAAATEPTPATDGELLAVEDAAALQTLQRQLTACIKNLINIPLYAVRLCTYAVSHLALQTAWPFCTLAHPSP
jgi:hypothetical protein